MYLKNNEIEHNRYYFISGNDFMLDYTPFERDESNGRCYFLEVSTSMTSRAGREGALVRRRISTAEYEQALARCKKVFSEESFYKSQKTKEEVIKTTPEDKLYFMADCLEKRLDTEEIFIPHINGDQMILDFYEELQVCPEKIPCSLEKCDPNGIVYGYGVAMQQLGYSSQGAESILKDHFLPPVTNEIKSENLKDKLKQMIEEPLSAPQCLQIDFSGEPPPMHKSENRFEPESESSFAFADALLEDIIVSMFGSGRMLNPDEKKLEQILLHLAKLNRREKLAADSEHQAKLIEIARLLETGYIEFWIEAENPESIVIKVFDSVLHRITGELTLKRINQKHYCLDQYISL